MMWPSSLQVRLGLSLGLVLTILWLAAATVPSANTKDGNLHYGYQWWMPKDPRDGEFFGIGVYGQYIYINRPHGVVIAVNSADRKFKESGVTDGNIALFREIAETAGG